MVGFVASGPTATAEERDEGQGIDILRFFAGSRRSCSGHSTGLSGGKNVSPSISAWT